MTQWEFISCTSERTYQNQKPNIILVLNDRPKPLLDPNAVHFHFLNHGFFQKLSKIKDPLLKNLRFFMTGTSLWSTWTFPFAQILDSFNISIVKQSFIIPYTKIQYLYTLDDANETFLDSSLTFPYSWDIQQINELFLRILWYQTYSLESPNVEIF